jgi:hypothetical protein
MDRRYLYIILILNFLTMFAAAKIKLDRRNIESDGLKPTPEKPEIERKEPKPEIEPEPPVPQTPAPEITIEEPIRSVSNLGKVLSDIDSHMPAGHIYRDSDKITWGHETTHGIHSRLRMKLSRSRRFYGNLLEQWRFTPTGRPVYWSNARINVMYVLENRAVVIDEPDTTIRAAAQLVPQSLRGGVYRLYMVSQAAQWNDTPLYVFDEWVAYGNGAAVREDLKIESRQETVQYMLEFNNYSLAVAMACKTEDAQFKSFLKWNLERSMELYKSNLSIGDLSKSTAYLENTRTSNDASELREFARNYLGRDWCKKVLGY